MQRRTESSCFIFYQLSFVSLSSQIMPHFVTKFVHETFEVRFVNPPFVNPPPGLRPGPPLLPPPELPPPFRPPPRSNTSDSSNSSNSSNSSDSSNYLDRFDQVRSRPCTSLVLTPGLDSSRSPSASCDEHDAFPHFRLSTRNVLNIPYFFLENIS